MQWFGKGKVEVMDMKDTRSTAPARRAEAQQASIRITLRRSMFAVYLPNEHLFV